MKLKKFNEYKYNESNILDKFVFEKFKERNIHDVINSLLSKTVKRGATEEEEKTFKNKALELIQKHNISLNELDIDSDLKSKLSNQILENPDKWVLFINGEPIAGMEFLSDLLTDILIPMIADSENEEFEMEDKVQDFLSEVGFYEIEQEEVDFFLKSLLYDFEKIELYPITIKKR